MNGDRAISDDYIGEGDNHTMKFAMEDAIGLAVNDVAMIGAQPMQNGMHSSSFISNLTMTDNRSSGSATTSSFRTDTEISSREIATPRERELQRWEPGADSSIDMALEDSGDTSWDQFATNERMYGVQSSYDENIYTTAIDRSNPMYKQREAEAARIAREIEGSVAASAHVAEERQRDADRTIGLDEEAKYSGVQREAVNLPKRSVGAYVPPSQRPITGVATVTGAPFDPAIISSQLARPSPSPMASGDATAARSVESTTAEKHASTAADSSTDDASSQDIPQPLPIPRRPFEITAEDHVRNTSEAFKLFASDQKQKARQVAEAKNEAKRNASRAEKNVKLNDLKKFAENFKLKSRVPDDLVPILAKDPHKQVEIQHKAEEAAKLEEVRVKDMEKASSVAAASPTPSASSSQVPPTPPIDRGMPFSQSSGSRTRVPPNLRQIPIQQSPAKGLPQGASSNNRSYHRTVPQIQALPPGMQMPSGAQMPDPSPLSPGPRLNAGAKAFEFRPAASMFTPTGASPSPQRNATTTMTRAPVSPAATFFSKEKKAEAKERKEFDDSFNALRRLREAEYNGDHKKVFTANGGVPQP